MTLHVRVDLARVHFFRSVLVMIRSENGVGRIKPPGGKYEHTRVIAGNAVSLRGDTVQLGASGRAISRAAAELGRLGCEQADPDGKSALPTIQNFVRAVDQEAGARNR